MKTLKTIKEVIKEHTHIDKSFCDICKNEIKSRWSWDCSSIKIESKIWEVYPEWDFRNCSWIDCCVDCYEYKIRPLIETTFWIKFLEWDAEDSEVEKYENNL